MAHYRAHLHSLVVGSRCRDALISRSNQIFGVILANRSRRGWAAVVAVDDFVLALSSDSL